MFTDESTVPRSIFPERFVEADEAASFLHYSVRSIMQMARDGKIPRTRSATAPGSVGFS